MRTPFLLAAITVALMTASPATALPLVQMTMTAKDVQVDVGADGRLTPGAEVGHVRYIFNVAIPDLLGGAGLAVCPTGNIVAQFHATGPAGYATYSLTPQSAIVQLTPQTRSQDVETRLSIVTTGAAPAGQTDVYTVTAVATTGGATACLYGDSNTARADALVLNG